MRGTQKRDTTLAQPTLGGLIDDLRTGRFTVPGFQRDYVWEGESVRQLMRSIFSDFFIGTLFLWNKDAIWQEMSGCEPIVGSGDARTNISQSRTVVLDGQQRLKAMRNAFFGNPQHAREWFFIDIAKFMSSAEGEPERDFAFIHARATKADMDWLSALTEDDRADVDTANSAFFPYQEWQGHRFPLRLLGAGREGAWLDSYINFWNKRATECAESADKHKQESERLQERIEKRNGSAVKEQWNRRRTRSIEQHELEREAEKANAAEATQRIICDQRKAKIKAMDDDLQILSSRGTQRGRSRQIGKERVKLSSELSRMNRILRERESQARKANDALAAFRNRVEEQDDNIMLDKDTEQWMFEAIEAEERVYDNERQAAEARKSANLGADFRSEIRSFLNSYAVPTLTIGDGVPQHIVSDMFSQLNRLGEQLTKFDLLNAFYSLQEFPLKKVTEEFEMRLNAQGLLDLSDRERSKRNNTRDNLMRIVLLDAYPHSGHGLQGDRYQLLLPESGRTAKAVDVRFDENDTPIQDARKFQDRWTQAQKMYEEGLSALRSESSYATILTDAKQPSDYIPSGGIIPVYCMLRYYTRATDDVEGSKTRLRQWYWASVLTESYHSSTTESSNAQQRQIDWFEVLDWFDDSLAKPWTVRHFEDSFGMDLLPKNRISRTQRQVSQIVKGIRGLLFILAPKDWLTGEQSEAQGVTEIRLVDEQWCRDHGIPVEISQSVFNEVLVGEGTSEIMTGRSPQQYLHTIFDRRSAGEVDTIMQSHCIPRVAYDLLNRDSLSKSELEAFLREREAEFLRRLAQEVFPDLNLDISRLQV